MAEERDKTIKELGELRKKNEKLTDIINQMQKQGRGLAQGMAGVVEGNMEGDYPEGDGDPEGTESEDDDVDDEEGSEEYDYPDGDEDTEEELHVGVQQPFGPVPPPPPSSQPTANGIAACVNGIKH
jgi:hypothetical protein